MNMNFLRPSSLIHSVEEGLISTLMLVGAVSTTTINWIGESRKQRRVAKATSKFEKQRAIYRACSDAELQLARSKFPVYLQD
jgi:hypothetical protein